MNWISYHIYLPLETNWQQILLIIIELTLTKLYRHPHHQHHDPCKHTHLRFASSPLSCWQTHSAHIPPPTTAPDPEEPDNISKSNRFMFTCSFGLRLCGWFRPGHQPKCKYHFKKWQTITIPFMPVAVTCCCCCMLCSQDKPPLSLKGRTDWRNYKCY